MEILLALAAAVSHGVSDFAGGVLTRRAHVFVVFLLSQLVSFALLLVVVALWADAVSWPGVGWGAAAGLAGVVGTQVDDAMLQEQAWWRTLIRMRSTGCCVASGGWAARTEVAVIRLRCLDGCAAAHDGEGLYRVPCGNHSHGALRTTCSQTRAS
jgi:hypothetical protein